jgi:cytochrome c-type biogenesis protein CcmE
LRIRADRREATFVLQGAVGAVSAVCSGPLPDNLAEDMDVVVEGRLDNANSLRGEKLLTRCASKYESG